MLQYWIIAVKLKLYNSLLELWTSDYIYKTFVELARMHGNRMTKMARSFASRFQGSLVKGGAGSKIVIERYRSPAICNPQDGARLALGTQQTYTFFFNVKRCSVKTMWRVCCKMCQTFAQPWKYRFVCEYLYTCTCWHWHVDTRSTCKLILLIVVF